MHACNQAMGWRLVIRTLPFHTNINQAHRGEYLHDRIEEELKWPYGNDLLYQIGGFDIYKRHVKVVPRNASG